MLFAMERFCPSTEILLKLNKTAAKVEHLFNINPDVSLLL